MDQGLAAVLAALIAIVGVGLGLFGAHWQARGMISAAQKQAESALEAVRSQAKHQNDQWRRTVSREVWAVFLKALDEFEQTSHAAANREVGEYANSTDIYDALTESVSIAEQKYREIELESPEGISNCARNALNAARIVYQNVSLQLVFRAGMERLTDALNSDDVAVSEAALAASHAMSRARNGDESVEVFFQAARVNTLTREQAMALTREPEYLGFVQVLSQDRQHFRDRRRTFVDAARGYLDGA